MKVIVAVDIGISRIKALVGRTGRWGTKIEAWHSIDYHHPARQESALDPDGSDLYEVALPALENALSDLQSKLPPRVQWRFSFSTLYGHVYPMVLQAASRKRLHIAADIYRDKLTDAQWEAAYRILWFNRKLREGEVLLWGWQEKPLDDLLVLLEQAVIKPAVIEFDALCLASAFERLASTEPVRLLIDFGFSKTLLLLMRGERLLQCRMVPRGIASVCERVGQRLNLPLCEVETRLAEPAADWTMWTEMSVHELFEPFLLHLQREIDETCDGHKPGEIYISGGPAAHKAFFTLIENTLKARVRRFDPLPADESVPWEQHPAFCTAYGLLTR